MASCLGFTTCVCFHLFFIINIDLRFGYAGLDNIGWSFPLELALICSRHGVWNASKSATHIWIILLVFPDAHIFFPWDITSHINGFVFDLSSNNTFQIVWYRFMILCSCVKLFTGTFAVVSLMTGLVVDKSSCEELFSPSLEATTSLYDGNNMSRFDYGLYYWHLSGFTKMHNTRAYMYCTVTLLPANRRDSIIIILIIDHRIMIGLTSYIVVLSQRRQRVTSRSKIQRQCNQQVVIHQRTPVKCSLVKSVLQQWLHS